MRWFIERRFSPIEAIVILEAYHVKDAPFWVLMLGWAALFTAMDLLRDRLGIGEKAHG